MPSGRQQAGCLQQWCPAQKGNLLIPSRLSISPGCPMPEGAPSLPAPGVLPQKVKSSQHLPSGQGHPRATREPTCQTLFPLPCLLPVGCTQGLLC